MNAYDTQSLLGEPRQGEANVNGDYATLERSTDQDSIRTRVQRFLTSKTGHYAILLLVSLDVTCIFADFLISLFICERACGQNLKATDSLEKAQEGLGIVSLVFSCLFMAELIASIWAFGLKYFKSKFHCFDAAVILAGFVIDVCLKGVLEEAGSMVVVLRLWRVFKIIEEFSSGAEEQMDALSERVEQLETENQNLKREMVALKGGRPMAAVAS